MELVVLMDLRIDTVSNLRPENFTGPGDWIEQVRGVGQVPMQTDGSHNTWRCAYLSHYPSTYTLWF